MKIGIIGSGTMGLGIALKCLISNLEVILITRNNDFTELKNKIEKEITKLKNKNKLDSNFIYMPRLNVSNDYQQLALADIIIECVAEDLKVKRAVIQQIEKINSTAILATNTSSFPLWTVFDNVITKNRCVGIHFMNPALSNPLIELIIADFTNQDTIDKTLTFINLLDKKFSISKDNSGFTVNRILIPMINEAFCLLEEGNKAEEIDKAMILGAQFPLGPLALADFIGLDICLAIMKTFETHLGNKYKPNDLLIEYVKQGHLGKKTGKGVYEYKK